MNFGDIITALQNGKIVKRSIWGEGICVVKQIDSDIKSDIVPKMQSLPNDARPFIIVASV